MRASLTTAVAVCALAGCINGDEVAAGDRSPTQRETATMSQHAFDPAGFSYGDALAELFGLPADRALPFEAPLLGAAMELRTGLSGGSLCALHVLFDSGAGLRLPEGDTITSISTHRTALPFALLEKPAPAVRKHISAQVRALSNRAIARFGKQPLTGAAKAGDDAEGSYTSMPLDGYHRELVPGVGWLSMPINCALAASDDYAHLTLFVEGEDSPADMILNGHVDPAQMVALRLPEAFYAAVKPALKAAVARDDDTPPGANKPPKAYRIAP
ncbi:MAG: hypothetical protein AAGD86_03190 [Pseudomonadota bacterium]